MFWIPNYVSFQTQSGQRLDQSGDHAFLCHDKPWSVAKARLDASSCTSRRRICRLSPSCTARGPFGANGILPPPGRTRIHPRHPTFLALCHQRRSYLGALHHPKPGYVQQYNLDIQRQLGAGFFADIAYAGSHGVHLPQYNHQHVPIRFRIHSLPRQLAVQPSCRNRSQNVDDRPAIGTCQQPES